MMFGLRTVLMISAEDDFPSGLEAASWAASGVNSYLILTKANAPPVWKYDIGRTRPVSIGFFIPLWMLPLSVALHGGRGRRRGMLRSLGEYAGNRPQYRE
jgi:hypothetical protein